MWIIVKCSIIGVLLSLTSAKNPSEYFALSLASRPVGSVEVVPPRYLNNSKSKAAVIVKLKDSGILQAEVNVGNPPRTVKLVFDTADRQTTIPQSVFETFHSESLTMTFLGKWRDDLELGKLRFEQEFSLVDEKEEEERGGHLGFNIDDTNTPLFNNILSKSMLGMSVFSFLLTRTSKQEKLIGELLIGDVERSLKNATIRFNPIPMDELGWALRVFDLRVDDEYLGYKGRAVIDTTTPFVILPKVYFNQIAKLLDIPVEESENLMLSKPLECKRLRNLPPLYFAIETDEFLWDAPRYTLALDDDNCILAIAGFDAERYGESVWIFGTSFFIDRVTVFDYGMQHIGLTDYEPDYESSNPDYENPNPGEGSNPIGQQLIDLGIREDREAL